MATYYLNGSPLEEGADITINGFTYPYSWLESTSPAVRASLGIEKLGDVNYDPKYYWDSTTPKNLEDIEEKDADGNPLYVQVWDADFDNGVNRTPGKMIDTEELLIRKGLKTLCNEEIKNITNELLKPTDFYILRNEVENLEIPESVSTYRSEVIVESTRLQTAISAVTSVEELIDIMNSIDFPKAE